MEVGVDTVRERLRKRLVADVYVEYIVDYVSKRFNVPREKITVIFEPWVARTIRPDLVLIYNNTWFVVEFKTTPKPEQDLAEVVKYREVVDEHVKPRKTIPILAYVYNAPAAQLQLIARSVKPPLVVLLLARGAYHVLYEDV